MADNFGLKIGLEGEKEFKKALADINQSFKVLGSEMKVVQSQFDKNDDSVEALTARNQVLGKEIDAQKKKIETLRQALENASTSFGENDRRTQQWQIQLNNAQAALNNMERELDQNQRAIDSMGDEMRDAAQQTDKFGDEIDDAADKTDKASGKLEKVGSVLKGLAVTAGAAVAAAGAALAGLTKSFLDLAESTREYREDQAKLDAAFTTAGFTAEQAGEAYTGFYAILGEEDRSVEAVNHLAKLCSTEEELAQWTDIAAGVWATFGDSLPIEGLTEAANETAKTGTITGQLADALNWAGVNEEAFQSALDGCSSEQERAALITDTLNGLYQEAAENYKTLNGDVMEAQRAQALLTDAYAQLGAIAEPIMTTLKTMAADVLTAMIPFASLMGEGLQGVLNGTAGAAETFAEGISGLVSVLMEKLSTIVPVIGEAILASLPVLLEAGVNIIATLVTGIVNALPQLAAAALSIVLQLVTSLTELAPQLLQAAMQVVATLASGIASALPQLVPTIVQMVVQICQTLIANLPLILDAALQLVTGLAQGILNALPVLIAALPEIINGIVTFLLNSIPPDHRDGHPASDLAGGGSAGHHHRHCRSHPADHRGDHHSRIKLHPADHPGWYRPAGVAHPGAAPDHHHHRGGYPADHHRHRERPHQQHPSNHPGGCRTAGVPDCESPDHHCGDREGDSADHHGDRLGSRPGRLPDCRGGRQPGARPVAGHPVPRRVDLG